jgi:NAD(P)-dependent dehydrogenase (short-subunit alcohol dehydrogenase family)
MEGRFCTPQDIPDVVVFLYLGTSMITGQTVVVDDALSL